MILQLVRGPFRGQYVRTIGPALTIVCQWKYQARRWSTAFDARSAWYEAGGKAADVRVIYELWNEGA